MGRKSSINRLPLPVKKAIDDALKTGRFTLTEILVSVRETFGDDVVPSQSALGRYSQRFDEIGKRMRESREVAQVWADRLGSEPQGDVGKVVMELLRTLAFDATLQMSENEMGVDADALNKLALAIHRLETAGRHNIERESKMRKAVLEEAAKHAGDAAKTAGLSDDAVEQIRTRIMMGGP